MFRHKSNRGITLLEMLAALVILGIIVQIMLMMFNVANRTMLRLNKATLAAQSVSSDANALFGWTDRQLDSGYTPILCFTGNATYSCLPASCTYDNGYTDGSHKCVGGILYAKGILK